MLSKDFPTAHEQHEYEQIEEKLYICKRCQHRVTRTGSGGTCIGVPIISTWEEMPETMATKTTLSREHGLKPDSKQAPVAAKKAYDRKGKFNGHYYPLYLIADAIPKKTMTAKQKDALKKAQAMAKRRNVICSDCGEDIWKDDYNILTITEKKYLARQDYYDNYLCKFCKDKRKSIRWSIDALQDANAVILDTETSDFHGEIIEIAVISMSGDILLNQRIKPQGDIATGAYNVHGISLDDLQNEPTFSEVYGSIKNAIEGKRVIIYNADYDTDRLNADCKRHDLPRIEYRSNCAMEVYAAYCGQWSHYHQSYRWQPLNGTHGAAGDCIATLEVIKEMSNEFK